MQECTQLPDGSRWYPPVGDVCAAREEKKSGEEIGTTEGIGMGNQMMSGCKMNADAEEQNHLMLGVMGETLKR
jgi:hypothetical protein